MTNPNRDGDCGASVRACPRDEAASTACCVVIESSAGSVEVQVPVGNVLLDAVGGETPIPSCCRSAGCGLCRVEVLAGAEHLTPPGDAELDVLDICGADSARVRLACQARPSKAGVRLRVRALES